MQEFSHKKKDIGYGYRWTFDNWHRIDLIDYKKKDTAVFRVGRGAWLVRQYPLLRDWFDEVLWVLAKLNLPTPEILHDKHIIGVLKLINQAPSGIGAFD